MNRINRLFNQKKNDILSIYFTAGHPTLNSTAEIIKSLAVSGCDMVEIGIPFSDPMADGPVIQSSSSLALRNGMTLKVLFQQLKDIRKEVDIPLLFMGYLNPVLQYGVERFCEDCRATGIDGVILPDLPMDIYQNEYSKLFTKHEISNIFLVSPQTSLERIRVIDQASDAFVYMVSSSSTTGIRNGFTAEQTGYFRRIRDMKLKNPVMAGFGISNHDGFVEVCRFANGAIIGSAFVKMLSESNNYPADIMRFVKQVR